jgi:putative ABC transport system ATP-binding protein
LAPLPVSRMQSPGDPGLQDRSASPAIYLSEMRFAWRHESGPVLNIRRLTVDRGRRVFVAGPSGSGKSTLLNLLAGISVPHAGQVNVLGSRLDTMGGASRDRFRADHMGVIFQMFNLVPYLSVVENTTLPCRFSRRRYAQANTSGGLRAEALRLLSRLGISDPLLHRSVTELSVGQQQRVAAARALMGAPEVILADEPTSALDAGHRRSFIRLLFEECDRAHITLLFASHDTALAPPFDQTVQLADINTAGGEHSGQTGQDR